MDIDKIEVVIRAIDLGSLSKAAVEFLYTPSAVSHILDTIENDVGVKFIKRSYAGITVEEGCEQIVENLRKMVKLQIKTKQLALEVRQNKKVLNIATYASLSKYIMTQIIKGYNEKNPDVHMNIIVADNMKSAFEEGSADVFFGERFDAENVCWTELVSDSYVAVFPKRLKMAGKSIKKEELYKYPFIKANDSKIAKYIDESKFEHMINVDSQDDSSVIYMVKEGLGVSVLPRLSLGEEKDVDIVNLESGFSRTIGFIYREGDILGKGELRSFVEYIKAFGVERLDI